MALADQLSLPAEPMSVRKARRFLEDRLARCDPTTAALAVLLLSELATNAVLHGGTPYTVRIGLADGRLRAEVRDANDTLPMVKRYDTTAVTGRGLQMVASQASRWGIDRHSAGKTVWFELEGLGPKDG